MADFTCDPSYLAPTAFKVAVDREKYPNIQFFAQQIQHPSMDLNPVEQSYRRIGAVSLPGDTLSFGTLEMDVLMDEKMNVYQEIYEWMERLVETKHRANTGRLYGDPDTLSTYCDIRVSVLSSHNNVSRVLKYVNAMPSSLGNITFASTQEGQYITFPVSFKFDYFELL
mgnify:FL=1|jgi:hypothetical protein